MWGARLPAGKGSPLEVPLLSMEWGMGATGGGGEGFEQDSLQGQGFLLAGLHSSWS